MHILITAFEPYDHWQQNASWLTLVELTKSMPETPRVTTRLYPVDFDAVGAKLEEDLTADVDVALHLGQAPGIGHVQLEAVGINVGGRREMRGEEYFPLADDGPAAYRSTLPLPQWARRLRDADIPAEVSYHAGTYLCNAILYLSHYMIERKGLKTQSAFLHLPLDPSQLPAAGNDEPSLPAIVSAGALRLLLKEMVEG